MTDALGNILGTIITTPDCSYCKSEPAFIRVDENKAACATCWTGIKLAIVAVPDINPSSDTGRAA